MIRLKTIVAVMALSLSPTLFGGTVITDNLPPHTAIVNIDARADGASGYSGDQSLWYAPFNTGGNLPRYTVAAGSYTFRLVDPADAAALFPALTVAQTNQIYTGWTYNYPWIEDYLVFDNAADANSSIPQLFDGAPDNNFGSPAAAYSGAIADRTYNLLRVGPLGRDSTNFTTVYTFPTNETLIFVIPDYGLVDNSGGVSVLVAPAGPILSIAQTGGMVTLQWPTNETGFTLAQSPALGLSNWSDVGVLPEIVSSNYAVSLPLGNGNAFFRLHKP
jgi:hypothetical protein